MGIFFVVHCQAVSKRVDKPQGRKSEEIIPIDLHFTLVKLNSGLVGRAWVDLDAQQAEHGERFHAYACPPTVLRPFITMKCINQTT
jgi:hypothetical protein